MTSRTITLTLILPLLLTVQPAEGSNIPLATAVIDSLASLAEFRQKIADMAASNVPPGTASELTRELLLKDQEFWEMLKHELAAALEKQMAQDELADLSARFGREPNQAWDSSQKSIIGISVSWRRARPKSAHISGNSAARSAFSLNRSKLLFNRPGLQEKQCL